MTAKLARIVPSEADAWAAPRGKDVVSGARRFRRVAKKEEGREALASRPELVSKFF